MFNLEDDEQVKVTRARGLGNTDEFPDEQAEDTNEAEHPLDSDANQELHRRLLGYYQQELDRQADNRAQMSIDEDFYDHIQWSEEDARALRERGQAPLVYNVISQSVNWVIGSEKRGRVDYKVLPRSEEDSKPAKRKTELMKYLSDVNRSPFNRSRAFEDAVKVGIGWLEDAVQDDDDGEPIYDRYESWRNVLWDSASTEMDLSDARYVVRSKWLDLDVAKALIPDRADIIELAAVKSANDIGYDLEYGDQPMDSQEEELDDYGIRATNTDARQRVRMIEVWFRVPRNIEKVVGGQFSGEVYDPEHPGHQQEIENGYAKVASRLQMQMHVAIMTVNGLCYVGESPYKHNKFPFTPIWGYRRGRDGLPYGMIRGLRDIQEDINKRASKALYILSTNKILMEEGAVDDIEEFREEASRPDAILQYKKGRQIDLNVDRELAPAHLDLMSRSISMIQSVSGVTDELMGRTTNASSGVAVEARQQQGQMSTSKFFDNLRFAWQLQGEKQLSLIEQFFTDEKVFRITNERGNPEFVNINDGMPENDIVSSKADFIISEGEWRASMRQAQAEQLMEMITRMPPEVAIVILDLVVESMDLPNREEIVKRIRAINGQRDPDATELTPEEQAQAQAQAEQQELQKQMVMAELRIKLAEAGKTEAETQKTLTEIETEIAQMVDKNVNSQKGAIEAAKEALAYPTVNRIADKIMREMGFVSAIEKQEAARAQQIEQAARQREAAMAEQMQGQQQGQQPQSPAGQGLPPQGEQPQAPDGAAPNQPM